MKPEQIKELRDKIMNTPSISKEATAEQMANALVWETIQATEQFILSHLETEEEMVEELAFQLWYYDNLDDDIEVTRDEWKAWGIDNKVDADNKQGYMGYADLLLFKLSPHLARVKELEGENERLKHDVKVLQDYNTEVIQNSGKVMDQAVRAERDRILNYLKDNGKFSSDKDSYGYFTQINFRKPIKEIWQALQK